MAPLQIRSALEHWDELLQHLRGLPPAVFLDFDGTLAPIASRPELATMTETTRAVLTALNAVAPVAIVTGRGLKDVRAKVDLPDLIFAANHGLEIEGPAFAHEADGALRETFETIASELAPTVRQVQGAVMESKGFSVAVHYRLVDASLVPTLARAVEQMAARYPAARVLTGKMVHELRPAIEWNKGTAVRWILNRLGAAGSKRSAVFVGDDRTDEDALKEVRSDGLGLIVGDPQWDSSAHFRLRDPDEVQTFLRRLTSTLAPP